MPLFIHILQHNQFDKSGDFFVDRMTKRANSSTLQHAAINHATDHQPTFFFASIHLIL
jgi:hypothetical protein